MTCVLTDGDRWDAVGGAATRDMPRHPREKNKKGPPIIHPLDRWKAEFQTSCADASVPGQIVVTLGVVSLSAGPQVQIMDALQAAVDD